VLFLTVSYFTENLAKSLELSLDDTNYDIRVRAGVGTEINDQLVELIASRGEVTEHTVLSEINAFSWLDEESASKDLRDRLWSDSDVQNDGKYQYYLDICALDDETLKAYAKAAGADYDRLISSQEPMGIVINTTSYRDPETLKFAEAKSSELKVGQSIDVFFYLPGESGEKLYSGKIEVAALTDEAPMGVSPAPPGGLSIIVSESTLKRILPEEVSDNLSVSVLLKSSDPMKTQYAIEEMPVYDFYVYNVFQSRQQNEQMIILMSVFTYGFIVLITAICIANIFNTISTSIALRKREFAMLKSVGMTPKSFSKMINYESIFYGLKALLYGMPVTIAIMFLLYREMMNSFNYKFTLPWTSILFAVAAVFIIVGSAMLYSGSKVKKENIIDALKKENI